MSALASPFIYGRLLESGELVDRQRELALLSDRLLGGGRHFLIGPRRYGKSSLLHVAAGAATAAGVPTIVVNAEGYTSLDALAGGLVAQASALIAPTLRERMLGIAEWFAQLKPVAEYDPISDNVSVSLTPRERAAPAQSLGETLDALDRLAKSRGILVGVIIDEFQVVHEFGGVSAERLLRARVQAHRHLSYVFAGSHTRMLLAMTSEHKRPFYRLGDSQFLGAVPRDDFTTFLRGAFAERGQTLTASGTEAILDLAADVPYNVQRLAAEVWDGYESRDRELSQREVQSALSVLVDRAHANYLALYLTFTATQRRVLAGMARGATLDEAVSVAARRIGVAASTFRAARDSFVNSDVLHERFDHDGERRAFAFVDPFFKVWLRGFVRA